jgi:hypothetical protein
MMLGLLGLLFVSTARVWTCGSGWGCGTWVVVVGGGVGTLLGPETSGRLDHWLLWWSGGCVL